MVKCGKCQKSFSVTRFKAHRRMCVLGETTPDGDSTDSDVMDKDPLVTLQTILTVAFKVLFPLGKSMSRVIATVVLVWPIYIRMLTYYMVRPAHDVFSACSGVFTMITSVYTFVGLLSPVENDATLSQIMTDVSDVMSSFLSNSLPDSRFSAERKSMALSKRVTKEILLLIPTLTLDDSGTEAALKLADKIKQGEKLLIELKTPGPVKRDLKDAIKAGADSLKQVADQMEEMAGDA